MVYARYMAPDCWKHLFSVYTLFLQLLLMLTLGQACCVVLNKIPTYENRQDSKAVCEKAGFWPTWLSNGDPEDPVCMNQVMMDLNPFKYHSYAPFPPPSPGLVVKSRSKHDN